MFARGSTCFLLCFLNSKETLENPWISTRYNGAPRCVIHLCSKYRFHQQYFDVRTVNVVLSGLLFSCLRLTDFFFFFLNQGKESISAVDVTWLKICLNGNQVHHFLIYRKYVNIVPCTSGIVFSWQWSV